MNDESSSESEPAEAKTGVDPVAQFASVPHEEEDVPLNKEPQVYLWNDWIQPVEVVRKPKELTTRDEVRAYIAKNWLIVTLMSLNTGYGSILESYQREYTASPPKLSTTTLEDPEILMQTQDSVLEERLTAAPAAMPPPTVLARQPDSALVNNVETAESRDANLKLYHVMSVKQTLREDLAEHAYQFSCRAADWSRSDFCSVPVHFEPLELHVVGALGQQEVPDYFQQPAKQRRPLQKM